MNEKDNEIAEELITYQFSGRETLTKLSSIFHAIMEKHGISRTNPIYNEESEKIGEQCNRFEWTLYHTLWLSSIDSWLNFYELLK